MASLSARFIVTVIPFLNLVLAVLTDRKVPSLESSNEARGDANAQTPVEVVAPMEH